ncbi:DUF788-domain-containing protein [Cylindrobasidium torrendii FP15055 ss-10]|uniref:DUF788-domain-containing protein n=1 Tax=Cylindrobasidium torrendii FP15055 ss-10 TaxID=1314674 RepID=A0A0D7BML8_9AGAR|nr:DUF788-domain-containing protein [Cylindrobasidium torrendii FP15055 ss-10]
MANASAKRIAQQNESTVKTLRLGLFAPTLISLVLRLLLHRSTQTKWSIIIYVLTYLPMFFLSNYLIRIGNSRRDPTTGTLISYGEDLSQPGVTEWCFDLLYITWTCQIGSGALGEWFWWLYMVIPMYAVYKLWSSVISPFFLGRSPAGPPAGAFSEQEAPSSKRQEKLKKRSERGDQRVRAVQSKK